MEQVRPRRAGARERIRPGSDEPLVGGIVDGGEDAIGRIRAILVGGLERHSVLAAPARASSRALTSIPAKKVAAWVGSPGCPSEPAASVSCQPRCGSARASERATCAEPPRGKKNRPTTTRPPR